MSEPAAFEAKVSLLFILVSYLFGHYAKNSSSVLLKYERCK